MLGIGAGVGLTIDLCDLPGRDRPGRDLVGDGLEEVEGASIDEGQVNGRASA
jgi:hypothetical protein